MGHKFSVLVQIDLHGAYVRLIITGVVSVINQHALHPVIARARTLIPSATVTVDLTGTEHVEPGAVDLLHWALEHESAVEATGPVEVLTAIDLPTHRPVHRPVTVLANHRARAGAPALLPRSA